MRVLTPEGAVGAQAQTRAASPASLVGARVALLDNGKPGAKRILEHVAVRLAERAKTQPARTFRKRTAATPCEAATLEEIEAAADIVLTGIAD